MKTVGLFYCCLVVTIFELNSVICNDYSLPSSSSSSSSLSESSSSESSSSSSSSSSDSSLLSYPPLSSSSLSQNIDQSSTGSIIINKINANSEIVGLNKDLITKARSFRVFRNEEFQYKCLDAINRKRLLHESTRPLSWGRNLTDYTVERAHSILRDIESQRDISKGRYALGESFFWYYDPYRYRSAEDAINTWYAESKNYNYNNPGFSAKTGGFTQLVWKSTRETACVMIEYESSEYFKTLLVCNFNPAGNVNGEFPYNVLPPRSKPGRPDNDYPTHPVQPGRPNYDRPQRPRPPYQRPPYRPPRPGYDSTSGGSQIVIEAASSNEDSQLMAKPVTVDVVPDTGSVKLDIIPIQSVSEKQQPQSSSSEEASPYFGSFDPEPQSSEPILQSYGSTLSQQQEESQSNEPKSYY